MIHFSSLASGTPNRSSPPGPSSRSKTVTEWPLWLSSAATASPAGPEPITATVLPVRRVRRVGRDPPFRVGALDDRQLDLLDRHRIVVDFSTHADSHGAGQIRPVNSGKLLVACSWSIASCHLPR